MARRRRNCAAIFLLFATITAALASERSALLQLKSSVFDPAGRLSGWSAADEPCSWPGVTCDSLSRVVALNVSGSSSPCPRSGPFRRSCPDPGGRLAGTLVAAVGELAELRVLSLPFHALAGEIPSSIWRLEHLEVLDLEGNLLSGSLPSNFPSGLRVLKLGSNLIEGWIPSTISGCKNLETLDLSGNQLNGTVPGFFSGLPKLKGLFLSFNRLGGSIPDGIGAGCWSLEHLDLSGNLLAGGIPRNLGNCNELRSLLLFSNLLDDVLPSELGRLRKLRVLDVSRNSLTGAVPSELGGCAELSVLVLTNPFDPVPYLYESSYDLDDCNYFEGGVSENITSLPNLRVLWAPRASLEGEIPSNWGNCASLEMVNFGENHFTKGIPEMIGECKNLKFLNLSSNRLTGWISEELPVSCWDVFDVSGNQFSGSIPRFVPKACSSSSASPGDDLSSAYSSFFEYQSRLRISLHSIKIGGDSVIYNNFGGNNFTGALPSLPLAFETYRNRTVYVFLADGNQLVGRVTDILFKDCKNLNGLITKLSDNMISGEVPAEIGSLCPSLMVFDIAGNRITGTIPQSFGSLEDLVSLDLSRNRIQGQIPLSLVNLKALERLSLAVNKLSGHIPAGFDKLHFLKKLDLSSNALSGEIPSGLVNSKNLSVLLLDNNKLSGKIPSGFSSMASLSMFNVSFNNLSGPLLLNGSAVSCNAVVGNPSLEPCPVVSLSSPQGHIQASRAYTESPPESSPSQSSSNSGFSSIEIASITSASAIVSVLLALIVLYVYTRKCARRSAVQSSGKREVTIFTDIGVPLTYESVVRATGSFNASNCIGSGGFGATYKAEVAPGVVVAIKRLSVGRLQGDQQFHAEIKTLGRWRHPNLVTLIGYHMSDAEMFLIYNYLPGGNLERFIQERSKRPVDWRVLHKIAIDIARALAYLHDHCVPRIVHRDVKPSNILLDKDFNAYLSDFGLARLLGNSETHATTGVAGTFGYVAPEYAMTCRVSDKADVYSYGVVLMELISDKALDPSFSPYGNGFNIVAWACMLLRQGRAVDFFTEGLWDLGPHDDLVETLHLAVMCTVDSLSIRPTMKHVVQRLKQLQPPTC